MIESSSRKTEVISICSGKGGVGKTLFASCLGYALTRAGLRVLMIDADLATDGLSLFLLGPKGTEYVESFSPENTFAGALASYGVSSVDSSGEAPGVQYQARKVYRNGPDDHGVIYDALISGRSLYGDIPASSLVAPAVNGDRYAFDNAAKTLFDSLRRSGNVDQEAFQAAVQELLDSIRRSVGGDRPTFQKAVQALFDSLRRSEEYDYIIVDTRGGFLFESTDICALADSFLVVIEADLTSFYQTRNLIRRINDAASALETKPVLRAFLVNKATDGMPEDGELDLAKIEVSFRNLLTREFPVKFSETHPVPADLAILQSYKLQSVPFLQAPASNFSYATLSAYSEIFQVVTSRWSESQVIGWQGLVNSVADAIREKNEQGRKIKERVQAEKTEFERMRQTIERAEHQEAVRIGVIDGLRRELKQVEAQIESERARTAALQDLVDKVSARTVVMSSRSEDSTSESSPLPMALRNESRGYRSSWLPWVVMMLVLLMMAALLGILWTMRHPRHSASPLVTPQPSSNNGGAASSSSNTSAGASNNANPPAHLPDVATNRTSSTHTPPSSYDRAMRLYNVKDYEDARRLFSKSCGAGDERACNRLGYMFEDGLGVERDDQQARAIWQKACNQGDPASCTSLKDLGKDAKDISTQQHSCADGSGGASCTSSQSPK